MTHFDNLLRHVPDLASRRILDLGSGKGDFLIDAAMRGASVTGVELNPAYIEEALQKVQQLNLVIPITRGRGEALPFPDESFDFVNMSEVIEHVEDPAMVLREVNRVLAPGGKVYISVPSRYCIRDPHYDLYFVNWLPRGWADGFTQLFRKQKHDSGVAGYQKLSEMHYYTYGEFIKASKKAGFNANDIREWRIKSAVPGSLRAIAFTLYRLIARPFYFDSSHLMLDKA